MLSRVPALTPEQKHAKMMAEVNAFTEEVGKVDVWRIANFDMVPVDPSLYGQFYSGDSYVILHSYADPRYTIPFCFVVYEARVPILTCILVYVRQGPASLGHLLLARP